VQARCRRSKLFEGKLDGLQTHAGSQIRALFNTDLCGQYQRPTLIILPARSWTRMEEGEPRFTPGVPQTALVPFFAGQALSIRPKGPQRLRYFVVKILTMGDQPLQESPYQ
jgi:hypothetical protein